MTLTRPIKIFIGLTTGWVVLYPLLFIVLWLVWVLGIGGIPVGTSFARELLRP